ncbi:HpcH/HpaI aldolase/citrate lyase family protein [uncultured Cloacibacillus sp.]|uniref:HpcH/HpaI aldolase family protein n=1 Tax=uncultured Cloacibacillus sp. TaxID=889794 RepID=UPI0026DB0597|nr:aldolase/citrate lyase family protein [uncultured Cloacibacillus sp.]
MKEKIHNGETVVGMFLSEIAAPNLIRLMQVAGVDFVVVDCEHGYFDYSQVAAIASVANGINFPIIVRIPEISRSCIQKYLDAGVDGIWVPMIRTAEQVKKLIEFGKYYPDGMRGISTMRPHSNYAPGKLVDYVKAANKRTMFFVQIENRDAVNNIEEIVDVKDLDGIFIGPNDLACDLGHLGNFDTPDMDDAILKVIKTAQKKNIPVGMVASNPEYLRKWAQAGMTMFSCDSELGLLKKGIQQMLSKVR